MCWSGEASVSELKRFDMVFGPYGIHQLSAACPPVGWCAPNTANDGSRRELLQDLIHIREVLVGTGIGCRSILPHMVAIDNIDAALLADTDQLSWVVAHLSRMARSVL